MTKQIKRAKLKSLIHSVSNTGFLRVYASPLSLASSLALANFSGERVEAVAVTMVAVEE
jgi:hypothetical protein